jgi:hypothetical protein
MKGNKMKNYQYIDHANHGSRTAGIRTHGRASGRNSREGGSEGAP